MGGHDRQVSGLTFPPEIADWLAGTNVPVVVTGAGGWLGRAALEMLEAALGSGFGARVSGFAASERVIGLRSGRQMRLLPLGALESSDLRAPLVFHGAFLTREYASLIPLEEYVAANRAIQGVVERFVSRRGAMGIFVPSSGAVYGAHGVVGRELTDNPYGVLKFEDEEAFAALGRRLGFTCAVIRVFNLSGPFMNKIHSYALGSIIADVLAGGPVRLRADRPVLRSYAFVGDVIGLAAAMLAGGFAVPAFDTAGETEIEIGALALRVTALLGRQEMKVERPAINGAAVDRYVGNKATYFALAEKCGVIPQNLDAQILATADYFAGSLPKVAE